MPVLLGRGGVKPRPKKLKKKRKHLPYANGIHDFSLIFLTKKISRVTVLIRVTVLLFLELGQNLVEKIREKYASTPRTGEVSAIFG